MYFFNYSQNTDLEPEESKDAHMIDGENVLNLIVILLKLEAGTGCLEEPKPCC
jgi:hypothetical protein